MKNVGEFFNSKNIFFLEKKVAKFFQVDITSSDLNEFLIGQKILEAETFLLNLSTTFKGFRTLPGQQTKNSGPAIFFCSLAFGLVSTAQLGFSAHMFYVLICFLRCHWCPNSVRPHAAGPNAHASQIIRGVAWDVFSKHQKAWVPIQVSFTSQTNLVQLLYRRI